VKNINGVSAMAMTKKEKKMVEDLKTKLALRFTEFVKPDIDYPKIGDGLINGYNFNSYAREVWKSCSTSYSHGIRNWDKTSSQQPIQQYSSKLLALKAMRNEIETKVARDLRSIDILIEKELEENHAGKNEEKENID
jgi:hypothetical protein